MVEHGVRAATGADVVPVKDRLRGHAVALSASS
jgi:hypothetical protein